jgi:hypothetical protein
VVRRSGAVLEQGLSDRLSIHGSPGSRILACPASYYLSVTQEFIAGWRNRNPGGGLILIFAVRGNPSYVSWLSRARSVQSILKICLNVRGQCGGISYVMFKEAKSCPQLSSAILITRLCPLKESLSVSRTGRSFPLLSHLRQSHRLHGSCTTEKSSTK